MRTSCCFEMSSPTWMALSVSEETLSLSKGFVAVQMVIDIAKVKFTFSPCTVVMMGLHCRSKLLEWL